MIEGPCIHDTKKEEGGKEQGKQEGVEQNESSNGLLGRISMYFMVNLCAGISEASLSTLHLRRPVRTSY